MAVHYNRLRPWEPDDEQTRTISFLAQGRRKVVGERTRLTNRLRSTLKMYFPQAITLSGGTLYKTMALDFLNKWPQLNDVQRAKDKTIQLFYSTHNSRSAARIKKRLQQYSGIAPVTKASGKSNVVIRRLACPKFLLQTFHEFANSSRRSSIWAQAYYAMLRKRGKSHHTAIRSLAFKWIRIMYCCWQNKTLYDEIKYIKALKRSNSPLLKFV